MENEKKTIIEETEAEELEKTTEPAETEEADTTESDDAELTVSEEETEETEQLEPEEETEETEQIETAPVKVSSKRIKKAERREAKAARKAANKIEEKKSRPNNALIALLIFGVVVAMFAFVIGYNYFSKPATIAKYIEKNGGEEAYGNMQLDAYTTANITADGNSMSIVMTVDGSDENIAKMVKEYYEGEDGEEQVKQIAAYFLTNIKPQTRAFSADVKATLSVGDEELQSVEMTYKDAKKYLEDLEKEAEKEAADDADDAADEAADAAEDAADDTADAAEDTADDTADAAEGAADDTADEAGDSAENE